jgi:hypothetical protein
MVNVDAQVLRDQWIAQEARRRHDLVRVVTPGWTPGEHVLMIVMLMLVVAAALFIPRMIVVASAAAFVALFIAYRVNARLDSVIRVLEKTRFLGEGDHSHSTHPTHSKHETPVHETSVN